MSGGGDGGGQNYYQNLDQLYAVQAQQAQQLMGLAQTSVYPQYQSFVNQAMNYGSQANQERQAAQAGADAAASTAANQQATAGQLESMGINPTDSRFVGTMRTMGIQGAADKAAAMTGARDNTRNVGFARQQDAIGLGMGVPSNATAAAQGAASTASSAANLGMQQQQINTANTANTVRGAMNLYTMAGYKDGGLVAKGYAVGGLISPVAAPAPPGRAPSGPDALTQGIGAASSGAMGYKLGQGLVGMGAKAANGIGSMTGSEGATAIGKGLQASLPAKAAGAAGTAASPASAAATSAVDAAMPSVSSGVGNAAAGAASSAGASTAATGAAAAGGDAAAGAVGTAAADAAAGSGLGAAAGAVGSALPWVGAALAVGSALNLFADGGHVSMKQSVSDNGNEPQDRVDGTQGGATHGPGGPKDDRIPAWLSDGEFVMPAGAVQLFGLHKLEQMRQKGLEHERGIGLRG